MSTYADEVLFDKNSSENTETSARKYSFTCPECGGHELEENLRGEADISYEVKNIFISPDGDVMADHGTPRVDVIDALEGEFRCASCRKEIPESTVARIALSSEIPVGCPVNHNGETAVVKEYREDNTVVIQILRDRSMKTVSADDLIAENLMDE